MECLLTTIVNFQYASDFIKLFALCVLVEFLFYADIQISRGIHYNAKNPLMYLFDKRYRWFTHINSLYEESLKRERPYEEFASWVQRQFIIRCIDHTYFNDEDRQTYVALLSQKDFVSEYFGKSTLYSYKYHRSVIKQWAEHKKRLSGNTE